jgi:hypothetical protein
MDEGLCQEDLVVLLKEGKRKRGKINIKPENEHRRYT